MLGDVVLAPLQIVAQKDVEHPGALLGIPGEDAERTAHYFNVLLGDGLQERKNFIAENGSKYLELADIS